MEATPRQRKAFYLEPDDRWMGTPASPVATFLHPANVPVTPHTYTFQLFLPPHFLPLDVLGQLSNEPPVLSKFQLLVVIDIQALHLLIEITDILQRMRGEVGGDQQGRCCYEPPYAEAVYL